MLHSHHLIEWNNRIVGIRGPRGVGKTTLMLQHIKKDLNPADVLYINADDIYFSDHRLVDLAERLVQRGIHYLFIDEIHKYKDWSKELKLIYDYYSELKVVFSGSSVLLHFEDYLRHGYYLDNTNLIYALAENEVNTGNLRETFFLNQTRVKNSVISSCISDFQIGRRTFEIGGKSKGKKQIENAEEGYVVKDGIEFSSDNILPLWWFGLNY